MTEDKRLPQLVSLACHDLRTPLATVYGFARTLSRVELPDPAPRYVEMIETASEQLTELLDELSVLARIEAGNYEPTLVAVDSLELARLAAAELEDGAVAVSGTGAPVLVEPEAARRALRQLARTARRHGGEDRVEFAVAGPEVALSPISRTAAPVVTGEQIRELGAVASVELIGALGGEVELQGETLFVRLPPARSSPAPR